MFAIIDGTLLVAPADHPGSHYDWLTAFYDAGPISMEGFVRGYVLGDRLVAYRGKDFSDDVPNAAVRLALSFFPGVREVGLGAVDTPGVMPWPCKSVYRKEDYLYGP